MSKRYRRFNKAVRTGNTRKVGKLRAYLFTLGIVVFMVLSFYSIDYLRKLFNLSSPPTSSIDGLINQVDKNISGALFNLGVSLKDVKVTREKRKDGELVWEFKLIRVKLTQIVKEEQIKSEFKRFLSDFYITKEFKKNSAFLIVNVSVYDIPTHTIKFDFEGKRPYSSNAIDSVFQQKDNRIKPQVAIIVDDLGLEKEPVDRIIGISKKLSLAVLPYLPYSRYTAEVAHKRGVDVLLHLPMEPKESSGYMGVDAGDGVLLVGLSKQEILSKLYRNLESVPYIKGVNNHMGSKFTENGELMEVVLREIKARGLFFIDSRTSPNTTGYQLARKLKVKTAQRDLFLDDPRRDEEYVRDQIRKLILISKEKGYAIGICHPYPATIKVLSESIHDIEKEVNVVPVSKLVE
ncbi:MAG: hypothetical protein KatS3mg078_0867 [Deltaproteobacteria bacterium]|nr:MAG: hypothetical protein KatS3mg078_0867 [Deltaproteobacteria bacterium]